jgi:tetratricopeptide (TPR) repeat protein
VTGGGDHGGHGGGGDDNVIYVSFDTGRIERRGRPAGDRTSSSAQPPEDRGTREQQEEEEDDALDPVERERLGAEQRPGGLASAPESEGPVPRRPNGDPIADLYGTAEVARLFGLTESRLRYWQRSGFLVPTGQAGARRYYTFQDLIGVRAAKGLLDEGLPLHRVRRSVDALQRTLPKVTRPLSELRVVADGQTVVVRDERGAFEATTGQLVLDFDVRSLRDDVVRILRPVRGDDRERRARAYERYLEGCRLDEDDATLDRAESAYREALELDPLLSNALVNLGNVRYRRGHEGEAEELYRRALTVDAAQPEAHYNLGFLCFERGRAEEAADHFDQALEQDPGFADAHFNLAMALEELGQGSRAARHWRAYLELDPSGPWAEIARRHLARPPSDGGPRGGSPRPRP